MLKVLNGKILLPLIAILFAASCPGSAAPDNRIHGKFSGEYTFYSLGLGDEGPPTKKDTKVNFYVSGPFASQLFYHLGNGAKGSSCGEEDRVEVREKGNVSCTRDRTTGEIECAFGYDLRNGRPAGGMIC